MYAEPHTTFKKRKGEQNVFPEPRMLRQQLQQKKGKGITRLLRLTPDSCVTTQN
jgi:hypothetical protein